MIDDITSAPAVYAVGPEMANEALRLSVADEEGGGLPAHPALSVEDLGSRVGWVHLSEPLDLGQSYGPEEWDGEYASVEPHMCQFHGLAWHVDDQVLDGMTYRYLTIVAYALRTAWADLTAIGRDWWASQIMTGSEIVIGVPDRLWIDGADETVRPGDDRVGYDGWSGPTFAHYRWLIVFAAIARSTAAPWTVEAPQRASTRRAQRVGTSVNEISIIDIPRRPTVSSDGPAGTGTPLRYRSPVGGHMRSVAYGPGHSLRRVQWIAPYIRGDDLPDRQRVYRTR